MKQDLLYFPFFLHFVKIKYSYKLCCSVIYFKEFYSIVQNHLILYLSLTFFNFSPTHMRMYADSHCVNH